MTPERTPSVVLPRGPLLIVQIAMSPTISPTMTTGPGIADLEEDRPRPCTDRRDRRRHRHLALCETGVERNDCPGSTQSCERSPHDGLTVEVPAEQGSECEDRQHPGQVVRQHHTHDASSPGRKTTKEVTGSRQGSSREC